MGALVGGHDLEQIKGTQLVAWSGSFGSGSISLFTLVLLI